MSRAVTTALFAALALDSGMMRLAKVARLSVPWFADWCSIALDQDGELRSLALAHVDPAKIALAEEFDVDEVMVHPVAGASASDPVDRNPGRERTLDLLASAVFAAA